MVLLNLNWPFAPAEIRSYPSRVTLYPITNNVIFMRIIKANATIPSAVTNAEASQSAIKTKPGPERIHEVMQQSGVTQNFTSLGMSTQPIQKPATLDAMPWKSSRSEE